MLGGVDGKLENNEVDAAADEEEEEEEEEEGLLGARGGAALFAPLVEVRSRVRTRGKQASERNI